MMSTIDYKNAICSLNKEADELEKQAKAHVKTVMSDLLKYVRSIKKQSDAIANKSAKLLNKRLKETYNDPNYNGCDKIAESLDDLQLTDTASIASACILDAAENISEKI